MRRASKRILILCEGHTEERYAKQMKHDLLPRELQRSISVEVSKGQQQDPLSLVNEAERKMRMAKRDRNSYDAIWLFFDHDHWPQLEDAFAKCQQLHFQQAFSAISLEYWFLLHFIETGRAFGSAQEVASVLTKHWPAYHKTKINHFTELRTRLEDAVERAHRINRKWNNEPFHERNPFVTIPELLAFFEALKSSYGAK
jgi:hypothetical protein